MAAFATPLLLPSRLRLHQPITPSRPARPAPVAVAEAPSTLEAFDDVVMNTYSRYPLEISHGKGTTLYSTTEKPYLDCVAGIATCTLGHAHPAVISAITAQMRRVTHVSNLYYIPEQARLARWLVENSPMQKVFFCNSGAEANEAAIKLARKQWHLRNPSPTPGTPVVLTAHLSFHGRTLATLTATGQPKYHKNWWPLVPGFDYFVYNDVHDLQAAADRAGPNLAAILIEAIQGEGGIHPADPAFMRAARRICDNTSALLVCDEVQVGMGRTGKLWGFQHTSVEPDVFTTAKGLGGGVPIGAMCCKAACDVFAPGDHASTFGGNPLAAAAGMAVATQLLEGRVLENARLRGAQLREGLEDVAARVGAIKEVRGVGLILGVELDNLPAAAVVGKAMELGLLLVPAGQNVVRFVPPLVITEEEVARAVDLFERALRQSL